ncbi:PREDICTED: uncharacterized protein C1orf167 homolog isoform X2 [Chinchilla lanigera]|uniref:uncharacterized protein C1orf167 homolog isoform X2 n=1 Tax=Chinchilla lanigera TaxID=34839 RepID=UPI00038E9A28|nr:PREDICTED: uncharacterized protein C1orf167 homolog isoform X2 [Chinchilla lanigera]
MEPRPVTSHKENVLLGPATPLRPEQQKFLRTQGVNLGSGHGSWPSSMCGAARGGPAATCSSGTALCQEPRRIQTNLSSPRPRRGPALKDTTGWLVNSSFPRQCNVQPRTRRPPGKAPAARQSNLGLTGAASPPPRGSLGALARLSPCLWQTRPATAPRPTASFAPPHGRTWPGPGFWGRLGGQTSRFTGEPLTLEDLAVPQAQRPSRAAIHQLLTSVQHLEWQAARLGGRASREPPGPAQRGPSPGGGQALPARAQHSRLALSSCDERRRHPHGHGEATDLWVTQGTQAGHSDPWAPSQPASPKTSLGMWTGRFHYSEREVLPAQSLRLEEQESAGPTSQRSDSREAWLGSSACSRAATAGRVLPGWEEVRPPMEPGEKTASGPPDEAPARRGVHWVEPREAGQQLLSRCFRAWMCVMRRQQAAGAAVALSRRQLFPEGFRALRWTLSLREAWLEVAWRRHAKALLAQTFREWRLLVVRRKQWQPHVQPSSRPCASWSGKDQVPHGGGEAAGCPTARSRAGSLREEEEAQPPPLNPGQRPDSGVEGDGGDRRVQTLQALQRLAVFLLWCQKKDGARKETGPLGEVTQRTQRTDVPPTAPQPGREWLCRCFRAWQQVVKREAQCQGHLADHRRRTLRICLGQWVQMKQRRESDGAKVTQLFLCWQKGGDLALRSSAHGLETMAPVSLQGACLRLSLGRALLLWGTRLSQRQRANSFFQGTRERALRRVLSCWHQRVWGVDAPSASSAATSDLEPLDSTPGGSAWLGSSACRGSLEKSPGAPDLLDTLRTSDLQAAGLQQWDQRLLPWRAWGAARQCRSLQRRILLTWSHWSAAQGAWRELAACQACDRSCRAALGLWRRWLAQRQEAERWAQERGRGRARDALRHWHTCWQRQQLLREKYRRWVHGHLQGLRRAVFRGWRQEAARQRHMRSHFQAWCELGRDTGEPRAQGPAFQDAPRTRALGAALAAWQGARGVTARVQEQHVARPCVQHWSSRAQQGLAERQLRRAQAQQAFVAWQVALGQCHEAQQVALCWILELQGTCGVHAVQRLSAQALAAWAQGHVQRVAITQLLQAGLGRILRTHWAQWRTVLLRVRLDRGTQAQGASLRHWPRPASRGRLLLLMDAPAPWRQVPKGFTDPTPSRLLHAVPALGSGQHRPTPSRSGAESQVLRVRVCSRRQVTQHVQSGIEIGPWTPSHFNQVFF